MALCRGCRRRSSFMSMEIVMPKTGLTNTENTLDAWKVSEGDTVKKGQVLAEIESEKTTMPFESMEDGIIHLVAKAGDTVAVGGLTVSVLATPGHSEGSVTLRCGDVLFCGDTLFAGSCGRTDFPGGSMEKMMASLRRLGQLEGDLRVLPGHMEASTLDRERRWNPYLLQAMQ